jgi:imidazolonepropionase-like amidohydrolase
MNSRPLLAALACLAFLPTALNAAGAVTVFENVRIFDGKSDRLTAPRHVLVRGNVIEKISATPLPVDRRADTVVIAGEGRTLMPGLIDAHTHIMFASLPQSALLTADLGFIAVAATRTADAALRRGFTSFRDLGGPVFGLKRGIDAGLVPGPRIWPSGAHISQTGGHGDFRLPTDFPAGCCQLSYGERASGTAFADGEAQVLQRTREQFALGASQIKLMAGGGACWW